MKTESRAKISFHPWSYASENQNQSSKKFLQKTWNLPFSIRCLAVVPGDKLHFWGSVVAKFFITQGGRFIEVEAPDEAAARAMADKPTDAATAANPNLTECPDCHHIVSTNAETCPSCGCKLKRPASTKPSASDIFKILFWIHQLILGLPSATIGLDFVIRGQTDGILAAIGLLLAWIGGTLVWGLAALMHRR